MQSAEIIFFLCSIIADAAVVWPVIRNKKHTYYSSYLLPARLHIM